MYDYTSCLYPTCMNIHPTYIPYVLIYILPISHCTKVIGSIPEGDQKGHKYTCFARSALCTGNLYDSYALVRHLPKDTALTLPDTSVGLLVTAAPFITIAA